MPSIVVSMVRIPLSPRGSNRSSIDRMHQFRDRYHAVMHDSDREQVLDHWPCPSLHLADTDACVGQQGSSRLSLFEEGQFCSVASHQRAELRCELTYLLG